MRVVRKTLTKLEVFRNVVELEGLSRASERLGLKWSAVIHRVANLEAGLGCTLLTGGCAGTSLISKREMIFTFNIAVFNSLFPKSVWSGNHSVMY